MGIQDGIREPADDDGSINICSADSGIQADPSQLFVAAEIGDDSAGCTEQTPCRTIGAAIATAEGHSEFHLIYVASINPKNNKGVGVYPESITPPAGMEIQGGWYARGSNPTVQWQQVCDATIEDQTANISGTDSAAIHAENLNGSTTLTKVVVKTKSPAPGESVYGIFAGASAKIVLNQVRLDVGNAGDGNTGTTGTDGDPGSSTCMIPGTGAPGADGKGGAPAPLAVFNATGAVSANGTSGEDGDFGSNGLVGPDGGCANCVTCVVGSSCGNPAAKQCGSGGMAGCAGTGGTGGGAGQSGGSSIGIFAWGSLVSVNGGIVHSGKGGSGGLGGLGGKGGIGSNGGEGMQSSTCDTSCLNLGISCGSTGTGKGSAGGPGTPGGRGGNGGTGAIGAGGDSVAIVSGLDASILTDAGDPVDIAAGAAGDPGGLSGARFP
ncbi:MAG: hypothetical protein ACRELY_05380 [Polyangiaceae bacterium]